jgi:hypothetical protein
MTLLRAFTWYFRFTDRQSRRFVGLFKRPSSHAYGLANCAFSVILPSITGAALFAFLYATGLAPLIWGDNLPPFFFSDAGTYLANGAITFALSAIVIATLYFLLGCLCLLPDAFRPPNYQTKRPPWKDWPDDP